jgi:hypothetical protein
MVVLVLWNELSIDGGVGIMIDDGVDGCNDGVDGCGATGRMGGSVEKSWILVPTWLFVDFSFFSLCISTSESRLTHALTVASWRRRSASHHVVGLRWAMAPCKGVNKISR